MVVVTTCSSQLSRDISHGWHHVDAATGIDREFIVQSYRVDVAKKQTILLLEEEVI